LNSYFVTGATGVIGSALVPELLADPWTRVLLLVRATDDGAALRRLDELFSFWTFGALEPEFRRRVRVVRGDATETRFGLDDSAYETLLASTTHVVHAAGAVRMNLPIDQARHSAVDSAQQIIELAWELQRREQLRKVEFVSTVGVGGRLSTVPEDWIGQPREFHNTYEQAKAEAEQLVQTEVERGLRLTVHRPSMVVGDSRTGRIVHFQVFYHLCEFLSGRRTYGLFPPLGDARVDIVPSDYVAQVIVRSSTMPELSGRVLHEASGAESLSISHLRDVVRSQLEGRGIALPSAKTVPSWLFRSAIRVAGLMADKRTRRAINTLPVFLDYMATNQRFEDLQTRELFSRPAAGIEPPNLAGALANVLEYYLDRRQTAARH
jgi:thioester reductase-like protein